ncbi:MAG: alpha/beta hydrolase [Clostridia bacterium]|nr:alpha/beta hydrolase [Clostridia bacterium]
MDTPRIALEEQFPFLGDGNGLLRCYLQEPCLDGEPPRPALLILPGGGYHFCSPREGEPIALSFLDLGIQCFVLDYSVAPEHRWPQALLEVSAAMELIRRNAEKWHIDPEKLLVCGFSAGGHLAASYCTLRRDPDIARHITPPDPAGALLCYPVITAEPELRHEGSFLCLTGEAEITAAAVERFSLERHVKAGITPPTFLWHTAADRSVPVENTLLYSMALSRENIPFSAHIFPHGAHGLATVDARTVPRDQADPQAAQWIGLARLWLKELLKL